MEAEPEKETDVKPEGMPKPVIPPPHIPPPPTIAPPPPPPPSPMASAPPPVSSGDPAVKVTLRTGDTESPVAIGAVPFNTRVVAAVIDSVVSAGVTMLLVWILPGFIAGKLAWLASAAYLVTRDSLPFLGGQSVGKKAMKIRAVTLDGKPLTGNWEAGGIRSAVLLIPFFALVEVYILLTRENGPDRGRRLGDEWAKTKVIFEPQPLLTEETPAS